MRINLRRNRCWWEERGRCECIQSTAVQWQKEKIWAHYLDTAHLPSFLSIFSKWSLSSRSSLFPIIWPSFRIPRQSFVRFTSLGLLFCCISQHFLVQFRTVKFHWVSWVMISARWLQTIFCRRGRSRCIFHCSLPSNCKIETESKIVSAVAKTAPSSWVFTAGLLLFYF